MDIRFDRGPLKRPERRGDALVIEGYAARVHKPGDPLKYAHGDEYRDASELKRIVDQLPGKPVTLGHPAKLIKRGGTARIVGRVDSAWLDGDLAGVRMTVMDAAAASAINSGAHQLSLGYETSVDDAGYQRDTHVDHNAIVPSARCGDTCSLRTDARLDCSATCACHADAELTAAARGNLASEKFADPGARKLPIENAAHVRAAMSRFSQTHFADATEKRAAFHAILAAAKRFGIDAQGFDAAHRMDEFADAIARGRQIGALRKSVPAIAKG